MSARQAVLAGRLPASTWSRELLVTLARPRALVLKVGVPLVLVIPLVAGHAPSFWAATLLTVMVAMIGAVGSATTLARARSSGVLQRLALTPRPAWRVLGGVVGAGVVIDMLQLLPVMVIVAATGGGDAAAVAALPLAVLGALLLGHVVGCAVAVLTGSVAEVLLDAVVLLAPLLFLGGIFTGIPRDGWRFAAAAADPFGELQSAWIAVLGGSPAFAPATVAATAVATICIATLLLAALCRPILEAR